MRRIYCDHSATTPVAPEVFSAMEPYMKENFGNPSSLHGFGQEVKTAVEHAREQVASLMNADPGEIVFTGCGSESDNLAVKGIAAELRSKGNHIITSKIEHSAVRITCRHMKSKGYDITYVPVDGEGRVDPDDVRKAIRKDTILISIMHANNEVGAVNPIDEIGAIARERDILFHTDAVQSYGKLPIDVRKTPVDLLALSGHKIYAPKGIGALYIRQGIKVEPLIHGGGQERYRRAGTENTAFIVALGAAAELCGKTMRADAEKSHKFTERLYAKLTEKIDGMVLNGPRTGRLPQVINLSFPGTDNEALLMNLDMKGIAVSGGSACSSGSLEPSHVLVAMGKSEEEMKSAIRFSFGRANTQEDLDYMIDVIPGVVEHLRSVSVTA